MAHYFIYNDSYIVFQVIYALFNMGYEKICDVNTKTL